MIFTQAIGLKIKILFMVNYFTVLKVHLFLTAALHMKSSTEYPRWRYRQLNLFSEFSQPAQ